MEGQCTVLDARARYVIPKTIISPRLFLYPFLFLSFVFFWDGGCWSLGHREDLALVSFMDLLDMDGFLDSKGFLLIFLGS